MSNQAVLKCKAFLTQITNSGINDQYTIYSMHQYTIYSMHAKRIRQWICMQALSNVENWRFQWIIIINIWISCVSLIYILKVSMNDGKIEILPDYLFVRIDCHRLMSKHSRFRLNLQYLFFFLNDAKYRQLKNGIYNGC